jgi:hypothetical protein
MFVGTVVDDFFDIVQTLNRPYHRSVVQMFHDRDTSSPYDRLARFHASTDLTRRELFSLWQRDSELTVFRATESKPSHYCSF